MIGEVSPMMQTSEIRKRVSNCGWNKNEQELFNDIRLEIQGLSTALQKYLGVSLAGFREEDLILFNLGYDFNAYCTTGVMQAENGPYLFRNLDWEGEIFRDFILEVEFVREDLTIFK